MDSWDWNSQTDWDTGEDRPFLTTLFRQWRSGAYGGLGPSVLNPERMGVSGYSVGAQMVRRRPVCDFRRESSAMRPQKSTRHA